MNEKELLLDKFKNISQRLLDSYRIPINLNRTFNITVEKSDDVFFDNNFRLADNYKTYEKWFRLPNFESFKIYYYKYATFCANVVCIIFISNIECIYVEIVL